MRSVLEELYDVRSAKSPKTALSVLDNTDVDLILLDIEMPEMNGFEFLKEFYKKNPHAKKTPVIFVTSHATPDFINKAFSAGAKDYLLKPVNADELLNKIKSIIGVHKDDSNLTAFQIRLKTLLSAVCEGDITRADACIEELLVLAKGKNSDFGIVEKISILIKSSEYDKAIDEIKKIQELR
jgi:DNA-binding response OmpR family regulator